MAATMVNGAILEWNKAKAMPVLQAVNATDGAVITPAGADHKMLILLENGAASGKTATVIGGKGAMAMDSLAIAIPANSQVALTLESGRYMDEQGNIRIAGESTLKVGCVLLP